MPSKRTRPSKSNPRRAARDLQHNAAAEQSVLGALLIDPASFDTLGDFLKPEDFFYPAHQVIFRHLRKMLIANKVTDILTVADAMEHERVLDNVGQYLIEIASATPSAANLRGYAEVVRELSLLRGAHEVGTEIVELSKDTQGKSATEVLLEIERKVFALVERQVLGKPVFTVMSDAARIAEAEIRKRALNPGQLLGVSTGIASLDAITLGLQPGDYILIAARPSQGKTALALQIAEHVARDAAVLFFSMEMSTISLTLRLAAARSGIDGQKLRQGALEPEDWTALSNAMARLSDTQLLIDDSAGLTITDIRARARRAARSHKVAMIVVDYIQLATSGAQEQNRASEVSAISRGMKSLAKELGVPVMALSQLNRALESRADKRPVMSDLRESGGIEQDADLIVFVHRPVMYDKNADPEYTELVIGKQRNGPTGTLVLRFDGPRTQFHDAPQPDEIHDPRRTLREE